MKNRSVSVFQAALIGAVLVGGAWTDPGRVTAAVLFTGSASHSSEAALPLDAPVHARMAAEHAQDVMAFEPGERPTVPLAPSGVTFAPAATDSSVTPLGLANSDIAGATLTALPNGLRKEVFGFLPYWMLDASDLQWMQYQLVSTIAYFGVAAKSDGTLATYSTGWTGWNSSAMTGVINAAHARGVKVVLSVTMMAWDSSSAAQQATLLNSAANRTRLINAIVATVRNRNADGVNLDFEPLSSTLRAQYTSFVRELKAALVAGGVGSSLTVCVTAGSATWTNGYDLPALVASGAADALFVMGYDYSWSGSARAGGVAPMESPYILDVNESVDDFLAVVPAAKIIWGVPYYGRTWRTQSSALNALTQPGASSTSVAYYYPTNLSLASTRGRLWDAVGRVPWFRYYDSAAASWVQGYYDDATSLAAKWDMVNQRGLAGTGMWSLLMDAGRQELWNLVANKFMTDVAPPTGGISALPPRTDGSAIPVSWRAVDVGSGVLDYSVQVRDRAGGTWANWLTNTTATSAHWIGAAGHAYEFRVSAVDRRGNRQAWVGSPMDPGASLVVGGFAQVTSDTLNVRSGAGTSFGIQATLSRGARIFLAGGPVAAGGYNWYQVYHGWTEWPIADYPRVGWAAAGTADTAYLVPATAPNVTVLAPAVTDLAATPRRFSPNGDGVADGVTVSFGLATAASAARLEIVNGAGTVVAGMDLGPLSAGVQTAAWDGRRTDGSWAPAGAYLPRLTVTDGSGVHVSPTAGVDATILGAWGVTADLTAPAVAAAAPTGTLVATTANASATFSEPISGTGTPLSLVDAESGQPVPVTASYDPATRRAILDPAAALLPDHEYQVAVNPAWRDLAGNPFATAEWTFRTIPQGVTAFAPARSVWFVAATHTGYRFDANGVVTTTKTAILARGSSAATSLRSTVIAGQPGAWLLIDNGIWAGYWIRESTTSYVRGEVGRTDFVPARTVSFASGSHTGYRFTATGAVIASRVYSLANASSAATSARAVINGRPYLLVTNGVWAAYWVPESSRVILR